MARAILAVVLLVAAGCARLPGSYNCEESSECVRNGVQGVCEFNGACSFLDAACESGRRYADGSEFSGICVGEEGTEEGCAAQLAVGGQHACVLREDSTVWCWGFNAFGQLGNGEMVDSAVPVQVVVADGQPFTTAVEISAGAFHTCLRDAAEGVWCWGRNTRGQLGLGAGELDKSHAVRAVDSRAVALSLGDDHSCALLNDGTTRCWGGNEVGQVGDVGTGSCTSTPDMFTPVAVRTTCSTGVGSEEVFQSMASIVTGGDTSCTVRDDGALYCWGSVGGITPDPISIEMSPVLAPTAVAAAVGHRCVIESGGSAYCWGANGGGQLGTGDKDSQGAPAAVLDRVGGSPIKGFVDVTAGMNHTCAVGPNMDVFCWGSNLSGQLGIPGTTEALTPAVVPEQTGVAEIRAGDVFTCIRYFGGAIRCFGANDKGQVGNGLATPEPVGAPGLVTIPCPE